MMNTKMILLIITFFLSQNIYAQPISNEKLFVKCYRQLTQSEMPLDHSFYLQVQSGNLDPVVACINLITSAIFTEEEVTPDTEDTNKILNNFSKLHQSWFHTQLFLSTVKVWRGARKYVDLSSSGYYYTKSLLDDNWDLRKVLLHNGILRAIRENHKPSGSWDPTSNEYTTLDTSSFKTVNPEDSLFYDTGKLRGIHELPNIDVVNHPTNYPKEVENHYHFLSNLAYDPFKDTAAGILSSYNYIIQNQQGGCIADGADKMCREFSRIVIKDFMCRELPVLRAVDVSRFKSIKDNAPEFRKGSLCLTCHVTTDPLSSILRKWRVKETDLYRDYHGGKYGYMDLSNPKPGFEFWLEEPSAYFSNYPAIGKLFYRTYKGKLVEKDIDGLHHLGEIFLEEDDYYACITKRYYKYFTGIDVKLYDQGSNLYHSSDLEKEHLKVVTKLADCLKEETGSENAVVKSRAQIRLINRIFNLENYRDTNSSVVPDTSNICTSSP